MLTRRLFIAGALASVSSTVFSAPAMGDEAVTAGKDFLNVSPLAPTRKDKIEVVDFFSYACPHCLRFETMFTNWATMQSEDVVVRKCPAIWGRDFLPFAQAYFALEELNLVASHHMALFEYVVHQLERSERMEIQNAANDIQSFMVERGVDAIPWSKVVKSKVVSRKVNEARKLWKSYKVKNTPMVGVGGRYLTGPHLVRSYSRTLPTLDYLIEACRKSKA